MGKFDKKPTDNAEPLQKTVEDPKRPKLWTNDPDLQNQETGETTAAGRAHIAKQGGQKDKAEAEEEGTVGAVVATAKKEKKMSKEATAKTAPAKKTTTKAPAAKKEAKPAKASNDDRKILFVQKENPKRADAARRFGLYTKGMTVAEYLKKGGKKADVSYDAKMGFIKLSAK